MFNFKKPGDSLNASIPPEILEQMNVGEGDNLYVTQTADGIHLTPDDPEFKTVMKTAKDICDRYHDALQELAK